MKQSARKSTLCALHGKLYTYTVSASSPDVSDFDKQFAWLQFNMFCRTFPGFRPHGQDSNSRKFVYSLRIGLGGIFPHGCFTSFVKSLQVGHHWWSDMKSQKEMCNLTCMHMNSNYKTVHWSNRTSDLGCICILHGHLQFYCMAKLGKGDTPTPSTPRFFLSAFL